MQSEVARSPHLYAPPDQRIQLAECVKRHGGNAVVLGTVALGAFNRSLERHLEGSAASPAVIEAVHAARGGFVIPPMPASLSDEERRRVRSIIADSLSTTVRTMLWIAAALALASAASAALTIPGAERPARAPARA